VPRLFVYGTLRSGAVNHQVLTQHVARGGARFERLVSTLPRYDLVDLGAYPALLPTGTLAVHGELWIVDDRALAALDRFEGAPDLYRRTEIELEGEPVAQAYVWARGVPARARRIESGAFR